MHQLDSKNQLNPHLYIRKALIEAKEEEYFGQLADTTTMPKNSGKQIKQYAIMPLLHDNNVNDQGLDAKGVRVENGNLYGSTRDVGRIVGKLPVLSEAGGRVNRVGFARKEIVGSLEKFGFFYEYSEDLMNFDSESELEMHFNRELLNGAIAVNEDLIQMDLINNAGVVRYAGSAQAVNQIASELTYSDIMRLAIDLDNNHAPKRTQIITGTRMNDTKTLGATRVAFVGSELIPTLEAMKDMHDEPAFIPAHKYAAGTTLLKGERGAIGDFRVVVVPRMMYWGGAGAAAKKGQYHTDNRADVFPFLVVGSNSFTTVGFQSNTKGEHPFTIYKRPTGENAVSEIDPYGQRGITSIKWHYGFLAQRPEWIGLIKCTAKM